LCMI